MKLRSSLGWETCSFHHVFVINTTDVLLLGLDLMKQQKIQLDLENKAIKTGQFEIGVMIVEKDSRIRKGREPFEEHLQNIEKSSGELI